MEKFSAESIKKEEEGADKPIPPRMSPVNKIFGGNVDQRDYAAGLLDGRFIKKTKYRGEMDKTPELIEMINLANLITNQFRAKYGLDDVQIPADAVHIFPKGSDNLDKNDSGDYSPRLQEIRLVQGESKMHTMSIIAHEMLHFKSFNSMEVVPNNADPARAKLISSRIGLDVGTREGDENQRVLANLNEAVIEEMVQRYVHAAFAHPMFDSEKKKVEASNEESARAAEKKLQRGEDVYLSPEEHRNRKWVFIEEKNPNFLGKIVGRKKTIFVSTPYIKERNLLKFLVARIYNRNKEGFKNPDGVYEVFERAVMTGDLFELTRLVDGTFGRGTLRKIGDTSKTVEEIDKFLEGLK